MSNQEEEEKLNIPSFVRIINTSGFHIPASIINRAWVALTRQIATRSQEVARTVDNNFVAYFVTNALGFRSVIPTTTDTMTSYADAVYAANIGQNFTAGIIPEVLWKLNGYQELKLEIPIGEREASFDLRIWVEGFDNGSLSANLRLPSSHLSATPYINIGTTFGKTVWSTDFLYQRMKAHNEAITGLFNKDPETVQVWQDTVDTLFCKAGIDGEVPIISPACDDLYQFVKDNHRFLIQSSLNNDTKECITSMQGSNPKFPNFNNVSKLYYGLEVIPISSQGLSRLEPIMHSTKPSKAKAGKSKRRKAKRKIDGVEQAGESSAVATAQIEITEINSDETSKVEKILGVSTDENDTEPTINETSGATNLLGEAKTEKPVSISNPAAAEEGIIANQHETNLHVGSRSHEQSPCQFRTQSKSQAAQPTHHKIPRVTVLAKDTAVPATALARDEAVSVTALEATPTTVTAPAGNAPISVTNIPATVTDPTQYAASHRTPGPTRDTASSQTAVSTSGTASSQTTTKAKDVMTPQDAPPEEIKVISRITTAAGTSSIYTGTQIAPSHYPQEVIEDRARVIAEWRAKTPPPSLEDVRAKKASIKEERRQSIEFIRARTSSRASALGITFASTAAVNHSPNPPRPLEKVPEGTSNSAGNYGRAAEILKLPQSTHQAFESLSTATNKDSSITDLSLKLPGPAKQTQDTSFDNGDHKITTGSPKPAQLPHPVAKENVKPKSGKKVAPLPKDQEWSFPSQSPGRSASSAAPSVGKKQKKPRRNANPTTKPNVQSRVSVGTQTETGATSCSVGTQTDSGVATSIAEDLVPGAGPVPSREDESAGHGNTKPPPSVTTRTSLQRELELTSIVEDSALEQNRGGESARGRLTMAAPSTPHSHLVAELTGAGVPPSALTSLSRSGLEAHEATGCRQQPVGIRLEVETVTIGGVTFEA
ncbi:hypothetical protein V490_01522, partial [Pseudogymnoascus sp. VKM F-3557]